MNLLFNKQTESAQLQKIVMCREEHYNVGTGVVLSSIAVLMKCARMSFMSVLFFEIIDRVECP